MDSSRWSAKVPLFGNRIRASSTAAMKVIKQPRIFMSVTTRITQYGAIRSPRRHPGAPVQVHELRQTVWAADARALGFYTAKSPGLAPDPHSHSTLDHQKAGAKPESFWL